MNHLNDAQLVQYQILPSKVLYLNFIISVDRKPFECEVYRFKDKKFIKLYLCSILILVINTHNESFLALNLYAAHSKGFLSTELLI